MKIKDGDALYANRKHDRVGETVQDDDLFSKRVGWHPVVDARLSSYYYVVCLRIENLGG